MVHIKDSGVFDAPVDKIWKYLNDQDAHKHGFIKSWNPKVEGKIVTVDAEIVGPDGNAFTEKYQTTMNPPTGYTTETLEGPGKGSKYTQTYTADGDKTKVEIEGDWKVAGLDDEKTTKMILGLLETAFNEDNENLKKYS